MNDLRQRIGTLGVVPILMVVVGLLVPSKYSRVMLVVGGLWLVAQVVLFKPAEGGL